MVAAGKTPVLAGSDRRGSAWAGEGGWWAVLPVDPVEATARIELEVELAGRRTSVGELELRPDLDPPLERELVAERSAELAGPGPLVAICLATHEPDPDLLRRQVDSIREQTHGSWICLISDDASSGDGREAIEELIGGDRRFLFLPSDRRLGIYANFERALSLVPAQAEFVALADQDDAWHPGKLESLIGALEAEGEGALLAYSDMRVVDPSGTEISSTYWSHRPNNHRDFGGFLFANTVTGAATMIRRRLLNSALPFPPAHGICMHDHWLAQMALASGPIAYVDRPLMDYVQHRDAALGHLAANAGGRYGTPPLERALAWARLAVDRGRSLHWRARYFDLYCRLVQVSVVLAMRCGDDLSPERLALLDRVADPGSAARWLAGRIIRGGPESAWTLGREQVLLAGLAWSAANAARSRLEPTSILSRRPH